MRAVLVLTLIGCTHSSSPATCPAAFAPLSSTGSGIVSLDRKPRAYIRAVELRGVERELAATLARLLATRPGMQIDEAPLGDDLRRLWKSGVVADAQVEVEHDTEIVFVVAARDRVATVTVRGGDRFMARRFRLLAGAIYEPARIQRMADAAQLAYHHAGRGDAQVEVTHARGRGGVDVCVAANPGPQFVISGWTFPGSTLQATALVAALPKTDGKLNRKGGHYDPDGLELDRLYLQVAYWDRGYANVQLGETRVVRHGRRLELQVPIREGPVFHLGKVTTSHTVPFPLDVKPGDRFSRTQIANLRDSLMKRLDVLDVVPRTTLDVEHATIDLQFDIQWRWPWDALASWRLPR